MANPESVAGAVYRYHGVESDVYEGFLSAASKGKFFNRYIKDAYTWEIVER